MNIRALPRIFLATTLLLALYPARAELIRERLDGREGLVFLPSRMPPKGQRALVVVLHGGLGNAQRIADSEPGERGLNLNTVAEKNGFAVAYLNGTPVARLLGVDKLGWNAGGGCCGLPAALGVDDVAYIQSAVATLSAEYGIDPQRVFGIGHSNGAMMTQRLLCETSLYAAGIAISGPLNVSTSACPAARGRRVLAIHGAEDRNVPVAGGRGSQGLSKVAYSSEEQSRQVFTQSGARYELQIVAGADHQLAHLDSAIQQSEGQSIALKAARYFGLSP